ncbi:unnamed protein product [Lathyrus oleraceus]
MSLIQNILKARIVVMLQNSSVARREKNLNFKMLCPQLLAMRRVSYTKENSCMMDSKKSASLEKESLNSICQENNADEFRCADRGIDPDGEMPKDCGFFSIEAKDGCEYLGNSGSEKAPIETCHVGACI